MKLSLKLGGYELSIMAFINRKKTEEIHGWTSRCKDGKHIIMLDYDNVYKEWINDEITHLQQHFKLGKFILFRSSETSYHAICLDKVCLVELEAIMRNTSADSRHMRVPLKMGAKLVTLRYSEKKGSRPKYIYTLFSQYESREKSNAHKKLLKTLFPRIPGKVFKSGHYDALTQVIMAKYLI